MMFSGNWYEVVIGVTTDGQTVDPVATRQVKAAGIKKEVVFVGKATYVEVWPAEVWDSRYSVLDPENLERIIERLKKFGV